MIYAIYIYRERERQLDIFFTLCFFLFVGLVHFDASLDSEHFPRNGSRGSVPGLACGECTGRMASVLAKLAWPAGKAGLVNLPPQNEIRV